ncbi:hypothetical protein WICMUC_005131 [Wickerhamomyces mucosus]|uniref:Zn(2)-C6 fungal-type domain-containing protein n=1 Tax=Wickerhamomyces mucosus TaxID=1378264 RepID=A0A9P8P976_9ASCO|nr:hypothetical protein WICMUC_005131 [Wickerhamomyces mucosus]
MLVTFHSKTQSQPSESSNTTELSNITRTQIPSTSSQDIDIIKKNIDPSTSSDSKSFNIKHQFLKNHGCITCKIRKKKCSGDKPICSDCKRLNKNCVWIDENMSNEKIKEIRKRVKQEEEISKTLKRKKTKTNNVIKSIDLNDDTDKRNLKSLDDTIDKKDINDNNNIINDQDFNLTNSFEPKVIGSPSMIFQSFKSNYLNNLFQPLSPNTLTYLSATNTPSSVSSSLNNNKDNDDFNFESFQFNDLFETNIKKNKVWNLKPLDLDKEYNNIENNEFFIDFNLIQSPQLSPFPIDLQLDEIGIKFYEYYKNHLSSIVSIVPNESNYYKKIFLPMASTNKGILFTILAWSGYHLGGNEYITKADQYMELALNHLQNTQNFETEFEILQKLANLLIMCAVEICRGDVKKWPILLHWCFKIICKNGGLNSFISNKSSKWLIANFIYHDILTSSTNERGTYFPIEDYNKFLESNNIFDPLQGILKPLFKSIAEISSLASNNNNSNDLTKIQKLKDNIINSKPNYIDLLNFVNEDEKFIQLKLFKTFKITSILYLRQSLLKINSSSLESQYLLKDLLDSLNYVLNSSVESSLCFPMFIASIHCIDEDRILIINHLDQLIKRYNFKNLERIKFLILKIWDINSNGDKFINWFKIVKDLNWDISFA